MLVTDELRMAASLIGVRDATDGYKQIGEFRAHGIEPHDIALLPDGRTLVVANGGIRTHPDRGGEELNLASMRPSLVYVDVQTGDLLEEHRLAPALHQLSIRHLALAATVVESYQALPPGQAWISAESLGGLVRFGGVLFAAGLSIALPVAFAIVLVQLVMGMLSRTAPQLNLFAVGFPAALLAGMVLLAIAAPMIGEGIIGAIQLGLEEARRIATAS